MRTVLVVATACLLATTSVHAQPLSPGLDLRAFHPPADPGGSLYLEPSTTPGPAHWSVGAWLSYSHRSIVLEDTDGNVVVVPLQHQVSLDYYASLGVGESLAVGLALPTVVYQLGDGGDGLAPLPTSAIGDPAFVAKATLVRPDELGGFGLAALARVTAPTGDRNSYVSDTSVTGSMRLLAEVKLIALTLRATGGARVRPERVYVGEPFGHELPWGVGVGLRPQAFGWDDAGHWDWTLETRGSLGLTPSFAEGHQSPALMGVSARYTEGDISAILGTELPLNSAVGVPQVRVITGLGWAPRFYDSDKDGIANEVDECEELAEDRDGFEDTDGCPDFDNDEDGVPDPDDQCVSKAEDEDEFEDDDGCPDPDNDQDGIDDKDDACPLEAGPKSTDPKQHGCALRDMDGDGIGAKLDRCPNDAEDKDGYQDEDGCPDPDNDRDGVLDADDACPLQRGQARSNPRLSGCPNPDRDGDTYEDKSDKCPTQAEDFDGESDDDGCPDESLDKPVWQRGQPLVTVAEVAGKPVIRWRVAPRFLVSDENVQVDPQSMPTLRALAQKLNEKPHWVAMVGVRPTGPTPEAQQLALSKSFAMAHALRSFAYRDQAAESVAWTAVQRQPGAQASGVGVLIVVTKPPKLPARVLGKALKSPMDASKQPHPSNAQKPPQAPAR